MSRCQAVGVPSCTECPGAAAGACGENGLCSSDCDECFEESSPTIQVCDGIQRAEYRASLEEPQWLEAGRVYRVVVDLWATGLRFLKGHRSRLEVSSSAVPKFCRHLNTAEDPATATADPTRP